MLIFFRDFGCLTSIDIAFALRYIDVDNIKNRGEGFVCFIESSNSTIQIDRLLIDVVDAGSSIN